MITLPHAMEEILRRIPAEVPQCFREQARRAAEYIVRLESNPHAVEPELQALKSQLRHSSWISSIHNMHALDSRALSPQKALPLWLQEKAEHLVTLNPTEAQEVEEVFSKFLPSITGTNARHLQQGTYHAIRDTLASPKPGAFKCYIEGSALHQGLKKGEVQELLTRIKKDCPAFRDVKLNESNRLVLYFDGEVKEIEPILAEAAQKGMRIRGPAHDVFMVDPSGKFYVHHSNDYHLGQATAYTLDSHDPAAFLENYLNLCLKSGKAPDHPYRTSFVYANPQAALNASQLSQLEREAGVPIIVADHTKMRCRRPQPPQAITPHPNAPVLPADDKAFPDVPGVTWAKKEGSPPVQWTQQPLAPSGKREK